MFNKKNDFLNGLLYVVYADLPVPDPLPPSLRNTDRSDIWVQEGTPNADGSLTFSGAIKVNHDNTQTDQWNPAIAVNPAGTELFIGYYSRQKDPANNQMIMAYGARAVIPPSGLASATFNVFPISNTQFPPFFNGPEAVTVPANTWQYDHVWAQSDVCMDASASVTMPCPPTPYFETGNNPAVYEHFCADDYTWASADSSYFYFAWCDRSRTCGTAPNTRPDADVMFAKIRQ